LGVSYIGTVLYSKIFKTFMIFIQQFGNKIFLVSISYYCFKNVKDTLKYTSYTIIDVIMGIMNIEHYVAESRQLNKNHSQRDYYNYKTIFTPPNNFYVGNSNTFTNYVLEYISLLI